MLSVKQGGVDLGLNSSIPGHWRKFILNFQIVKKSEEQIILLSFRAVELNSLERWIPTHHMWPLRPTQSRTMDPNPPHVTLKAHPCNPSPRFQNFLSAFHVDCEEVPLKLQTFFSVQNIWNLSFVLVISSISKRTTCFHLDSFPCLLPAPFKLWACLSLHTAVNICSLKWNMLRSQLSESSLVWLALSVQLLHLTLVSLLFLWLLTSDVFSVNILLLLFREFSCFSVAVSNPFELSFVVIWLKRLETVS